MSAREILLTLSASAVQLAPLSGLVHEIQLHVPFALFGELQSESGAAPVDLGPITYSFNRIPHRLWRLDLKQSGVRMTFLASETLNGEQCLHCEAVGHAS